MLLHHEHIGKALSLQQMYILTIDRHLFSQQYAVTEIQNKNAEILHFQTKILVQTQGHIQCAWLNRRNVPACLTPQTCPDPDTCSANQIRVTK